MSQKGLLVEVDTPIYPSLSIKPQNSLLKGMIGITSLFFALFVGYNVVAYIKDDLRNKIDENKQRKKNERMERMRRNWRTIYGTRSMKINKEKNEKMERMRRNQRF
jgi:hypothetical protein